MLDVGQIPDAEGILITVIVWGWGWDGWEFIMEKLTCLRVTLGWLCGW